MIFIAIAPDYNEMRIHFCGPHTSYHAADKAMQNSINNGDIPVGLQFLVIGINEHKRFMIESVVMDTTRYDGDGNLLVAPQQTTQIPLPPPAPVIRPPAGDPPMTPRPPMKGPNRIRPARFNPDWIDPNDPQNSGTTQG